MTLLSGAKAMTFLCDTSCPISIQSNALLPETEGCSDFMAGRNMQRVQCQKHTDMN